VWFSSASALCRVRRLESGVWRRRVNAYRVIGCSSFGVGRERFDIWGVHPVFFDDSRGVIQLRIAECGMMIGGALGWLVGVGGVHGHSTPYRYCAGRCSENYELRITN
jgi:hypothetical protein